MWGRRDVCMWAQERRLAAPGMGCTILASSLKDHKACREASGGRVS